VANHAGTTPTRLRHDAGYAAAACICFLREQVRRRRPATTLATTGSLRLEPNLINVIARQATFTVDLRDPDEQRLQAAERVLPISSPTRRARGRDRSNRAVWCALSPVVFDAALAAASKPAAQARPASTGA
jgi:N-carbamoyl-L-amino-acid hydrolase